MQYPNLFPGCKRRRINACINIFLKLLGKSCAFLWCWKPYCFDSPGSPSRASSDSSVGLWSPSSDIWRDVLKNMARQNHHHIVTVMIIVNPRDILFIVYVFVIVVTSITTKASIANIANIFNINHHHHHHHHQHQHQHQSSSSSSSTTSTSTSTSTSIINHQSSS